MYSLDPLIVCPLIAFFWCCTLDVDDNDDVEDGELLLYDDGDEMFIALPSEDFILCCFVAVDGECI